MSLPSTGSQNEPNGQVYCTTTVRQTDEHLRVWSLLTNHGTKSSSGILSATKSSTYLFLVGVDCLVDVPPHYTDPT